MTDLKTQIAEILVKWEMPTRQSAIDEIAQLFHQHSASALGKKGGKKSWASQSKGKSKKQIHDMMRKKSLIYWGKKGVK